VAGPDECWEWQARRIKSGYGSMRWPTEGNPDSQKLGHRASWEIHNGPIPEGIMVCHKCDNRGCVNPDHLFLGTAKDNAQDAISKGRFVPPQGEEQWASKVTRIQAMHIRHSSKSLGALALEHDLSKATVSNIKKGKIWKPTNDVLMAMMDEVVSWIHPLSPSRNPFDTSIKLAGEISELQHVLHTGDGDVGTEVADCMILLLDLCFLLKINPDQELMKKMGINKNRKWREVMGCLKHEK